MAKKKTEEALPDQVYVVREIDGDSSWLCCYNDIDTIGDGEVVGLYELVETRKKTVRHMLTD